MFTAARNDAVAAFRVFTDGDVTAVVLCNTPVAGEAGRIVVNIVNILSFFASVWTLS